MGHLILDYRHIIDSIFFFPFLCLSFNLCLILLQAWLLTCHREHSSVRVYDYKCNRAAGGSIPLCLISALILTYKQIDFRVRGNLTNRYTEITGSEKWGDNGAIVWLTSTGVCNLSHCEILSLQVKLRATHLISNEDAKSSSGTYCWKHLSNYPEISIQYWSSHTHPR